MFGQILAAVGSQLLGGLFSRGDRRRAKKAQKQQEAILRQLQALATEGAGRGREFLDTYQRDFLPVAREAIDAARQVGRPDLAGISADNATAFQQQGDAMVREMRRAGVNPLDGAWSGAISDLKNNEAASLVLNRNAARRVAANDRYTALSGAAGLGSMPLQAGLSMFGDAQSALAGVGDRYGQNAQMYRDSAAATTAAVSNLAGQTFGAFKATPGAPAGGKNIPWGNFVQRVGTPNAMNMAPTGAGMPGYMPGTSAAGQWWGIGGR